MNSKYIYVLVAFFWAIVVLVSLWWNHLIVDNQLANKATDRAEFAVKVIEITRLWNAKHGGIYVRVDDNTKPNPYLMVPDRDLTSTNGIELTMMNPSYMTREIVELAKQMSGLNMHLTSLKLRNPNNAPDEWERKQLELFEKGNTFGREYFKDKKYFRYMTALKVEESCLKCHADQDYKVGDVRGGLSVSFDVSSILEMEKAQDRMILFMHIIAWIVLSILSWIYVYRSRRYMQQIEDAKDEAEALVKLKTQDLQKLSFATSFSPVSIIITNSDGVIEYVNPKFTEITGYEKDEVVGLKPSVLKSNKTEIATYKDLWRTIKSKQEWQGELLNRAKDGKEFWESVKISPIIDENGNITNFVAVKEDITFKKMEQKQVWHQANFDALTDVPNRKYFNEILQSSLEKHQESNQSVALIYIDLDGFKPINDTLGHACGDMLLKELAQRLQKSLRSHDVVARLGGDEFIVLLTSSVDRDGVAKVAHALLEVIAKPFYLDRKEPSFVTASIGIVLSNGYSQKELIKKADKAMYEAKKGGKNRYVFYEDIEKKTL